MIQRLKKSKNTIWQVSKAVLFLQKVAVGTAKITLKVSHDLYVL